MSLIWIAFVLAAETPNIPLFQWLLHRAWHIDYPGGKAYLYPWHYTRPQLAYESAVYTATRGSVNSPQEHHKSFFCFHSPIHLSELAWIQILMLTQNVPDRDHNTAEYLCWQSAAVIEYQGTTSVLGLSESDWLTYAEP